MNRSIDVRKEVRRLTNSKPVCAAAGAGLLASQTIRSLPGRITRWRSETVVSALPTRAGEYVHTARVKAGDSYAKLAERGKRVLNGHEHATRKGAPGEKPKTASKTVSK